MLKIFSFHFSHVLNVGHIGKFVIVAEEAIAKGMRRIIAVSGPEGERVSLNAYPLLPSV